MMSNAYSIHINVDWGDEDEQWNRLTKICERWARVPYSKTQSSIIVGYEKIKMPTTKYAMHTAYTLTIQCRMKAKKEERKKEKMKHSEWAREKERDRCNEYIKAQRQTRSTNFVMTYPKLGLHTDERLDLIKKWE